MIWVSGVGPGQTNETTMTIKNLNAAALHEIEHADRYTLRTLQTWRDEVAKENSSPTYLISSFAEQQMEAEFMLRWIKAIRHSISDEGYGLDDLLKELDRSCDSWNPCNSTSLLVRLQGDIELRALRAARKLVRLILKKNAAEQEATL